MTDLLEQAMATARGLAPERQDDIARMVLAVVGGDDDLYVLSADEEADLDRSDVEVARREFASDEQMRAIWAKHDA